MADGIIPSLLARIDGVKRNVGRNVSDLIDNPRDYGNKVLGLIREAQAPKARNATELNEILGSLIPSPVGMVVNPARIGAKATHAGPIDGMPRAYLSDADARFNFDKLRVNQFDKELYGVDGSAKLSEILNHPELYKAYPELADMEVKNLFNFGASGSYDRVNKTIKLGGISSRREQDATETLLHEIQHAVQDIEGWTPGGNSLAFLPEPALYQEARKSTHKLLDEKTKKLAEAKSKGVDTTAEEEALKRIKEVADKYNLMDRELDIKYLRIGGEAEARATQHMFGNELQKRFVGPEPKPSWSSVLTSNPIIDSNKALDFYDVPLDELIQSPLIIK